MASRGRARYHWGNVVWRSAVTATAIAAVLVLGATSASAEEGKKKQVNIAQIREILSITLGLLRYYGSRSRERHAEVAEFIDRRGIQHPTKDGA